MYLLLGIRQCGRRSIQFQSFSLNHTFLFLRRFVPAKRLQHLDIFYSVNFNTNTNHLHTETLPTHPKGTRSYSFHRLAVLQPTMRENLYPIAPPGVPRGIQHHKNRSTSLYRNVSEVAIPDLKPRLRSLSNRLQDVVNPVVARAIPPITLTLRRKSWNSNTVLYDSRAKKSLIQLLNYTHQGFGSKQRDAVTMRVYTFSIARSLGVRVVENSFMFIEAF